MEARARHAGISERRACTLTGCALSSQRYHSRRPAQAELRARLRELALERVRWGYRRLHVLLRREGQRVKVKRVYRLYREEGLAVRRRKRKRVAVARAPMPAPERINECWAMDFMSDVLVGGRRFRILNVVDVHSHEALVGEVDTSLPASRVIQALEEVALERGYPARITIDNGPEFRSAALDAWAIGLRASSRPRSTVLTWESRLYEIGTARDSSEADPEPLMTNQALRTQLGGMLTPFVSELGSRSPPFTRSFHTRKSAL